MKSSERWNTMLPQIMMAGLCIVVVTHIAGCSGKANSERSPSTWLTALRESVKDADTLVVVIRGECEDLRAEPLTFRVRGKKEVDDFVNLIEIEFYTGEYVSMCAGNDSFEFLQAEKSLITLNRTPMTVLTRNGDDWKGDAVVSRASYHRIMDWFEARGFKHFKEEFAEAEANARQLQAANETLVASFPPEVRQLILRSEGTNGKIDTSQAIRLMPGPRETWVAICKSLGQLPKSESSWTMTVPLTRGVLSMAQATDQSVFWDAVQGLSDNNSAQLGAARLYFRERIGEQTTDVKKLPSILALATATLTDGFDQNKPSVLRELALMPEPAVTEYLRKIADGEVGIEIDRAEQWDEEPGIRASAVIGLGMRKTSVTDEDWDRWKQEFASPSDAAALEIAGCLLGKRTAIRPGHFRLKSYTLGDAGIEALSRTPGPESLGLLTAAMDHPWAAVADHAELAIEKMIGQSWERHNRRPRIDEWLATHRDSWTDPADTISP